MRKQLLCLTLFALVGPALAQAAEVEWVRAVYWDARYRTNWAAEADSVAVRDACVAAGYELLDADQLKTWMDARIADKEFSVVVFARDNAPNTVVETLTATCTLRKYLDAGGKIVFYADIPFWDIAAADGTFTNPQTAGANAILGFVTDIAVWDTNQTVKITAAGVKWGLTQTWASVRPISASAGVTILATDAAGNAAAWVRHYVKGDSFRGFVRLWDRGGHPPVEDIIRAAEYVGLKASDPSPADGAMGVGMPLLSWEPGGLAVFHKVYFGTTPELTEADLVGPQVHYLPFYVAQYALLKSGATYYWRIDEVEGDGTIRTGDVWSFTATPQNAWAPKPNDGAAYVDPNVMLEWQAGMGATRHDAYFGTDRAAVEAGTADTLKAGQQFALSYTPGTLQRGMTYYWRIDEVGSAGTVTGSVWSFTVRPIIPKSDPTLVGWYKLEDEKSGEAVDYSGWDYYGTLWGGPQWVEGYYGDALDLDGVDDYVDFGNPAAWPSGTAARSLCGWGKTDSVATGWRWIAAWGSPATSQAMFIGINGTALYGGGYGDDVYLDGFWDIGVWHHICLTYDGAMARLYADGIEVASAAKTWDLVPSRAHIGRQVNSAVEFWDGMVDDVRVYNVALTPEEIKEAMRGDIRLAWDPQPKPGANVDIRDATDLSWSPGDTAVKHDVYFGVDRDAVKTADTTAAEYQGRQTGTSFSLGGLVAFGGGSYFWRIDEVEADDATVHKGNVWGFTVPGYLIVDDFESYNDEENKGTRIYETWIDGWTTQDNGSTVGNWDPPFAERTIVHGGKQSMPMDYNNVNSPFYSEAYREWTSPQDWTGYGVTDLSLWVRGNAATFLETAPGQYTISSNTGDIWGTADNFRYVYKTLNGDGAISAKVISVTNTSAWAKPGVMIRASLDPASTYAFMFPTPDGRRAFQNRPAAGGSAVSAHSATGAVTLPLWVKVERKGSMFTAYYSTDGKTWIQQPDTENTGADASPNPQTIGMGSSVYIGLAVTSNNAAAGFCFAEFSDVVTSGSISGDWKVANVGPNPGNDPGPLYVTVQDSSNKTVTVTHPDPGAVNLTAWTEWKIPVSDLAGVNLARVKRLYIGVGDKSPDGTGRIYIDDIRVTTPGPTP